MHKKLSEDMIILDMPLKKRWYNMIECGEKPEEYRERTAYWIVRLLEWRSIQGSLEVVDNRITMDIIRKRITMAEARMIVDGSIDFAGRTLAPKHYDAVRFSYGYTKRRMTFEYKGLKIGKGRPEWGAPDYETFIIKLGKRL